MRNVNDIVALLILFFIVNISQTKMLNLALSFSAATSLGIVGYGKTKQTIFNTNNKLNKGEVTVWSHQECEKALELFNQRPIKEANICAGQYKYNDIWIGSCTDKVLLFEMHLSHILPALILLSARSLLLV